MVLRLSILSLPAGASGAETLKVLDGGELTIGRDTSSDWALPSKIVSRRHCVISGSGDRFCLTDTSKNGVYVDDEEMPIGEDKTVTLHDGQRLRIGDYEIQVEIDAAERQQHREQDFTVIEGVSQPMAGLPPIEAAERSNGAVDLFPGFDRDGRRDEHLPRQSKLDLDHPIGDRFEAPQPVPSAPSPGEAKPNDDILPNNIAEIVANNIPKQAPEQPEREQPEHIPESIGIEEPRRFSGLPEDDVPPPQGPATLPPVPEAGEPTDEPIERTPGEPPRTTSAPASPPARGAMAPIETDALAAFLAGAGLAPGSVNMADPVQAMRTIGEIFYSVVDSAMGLLDARSQIKKELALEQTILEAKGNNPLKFSSDPRQAVELLLDKRQRGYLSPREAFIEAFEDIAEHEYALLDGVRDAWNDLLGRVNPEILEERIAKEKGLATLVSSSKARCWDIYCERYKEIVEDGDRIFTARVAAAYEKQGGKHRRRRR
jgi:type VI secretion system protein